MSQPTTTQSITQFRSLFRSLVLDPALLYGQVLSAKIVAQVVHQEVGETDDRIYTPLVTLATFLFQILSKDHSCRNAVARLRGWRVARGLSPCSLATGGCAGPGIACPRRSCRDWCATQEQVSRSKQPNAGSSTAGRS